MRGIEVIEPGLLTTVQDMGRYSYLRFGVPVSGAMDSFALRVANILVGNPEGTACLEMTLMGPELRFLADSLIAIAGADLAPILDGEPMPMWQATIVREGQVLAFQGPQAGSRAYLAVSGSLEVSLVMGSRSTYMKARLGGLEGRALQAGDTLHWGNAQIPYHLVGLRPPRGLIPTYANQHVVRVITGPQDDAFTHKGLETFLSSTYTVTPRSDRMGYRLEGPQIEHKSTPDIISDGIPFGGIQVAGDGQPIVLMADRGTSGGYTKIATVISADLSEIAQAPPGDEVRFRAVSIEEAHRALRDQETALSYLHSQAETRPITQRFQMTLNGEPLEVEMELSDANTGEERTSGWVSITDRRGESTQFQVEGEAVE